LAVAVAGERQAVAGLGKHAVGDQDVEVNVQVDQTAESLQSLAPKPAAEHALAVASSRLDLPMAGRAATIVTIPACQRPVYSRSMRSRGRLPLSSTSLVALLAAPAAAEPLPQSPAPSSPHVQIGVEGALLLAGGIDEGPSPAAGLYARGALVPVQMREPFELAVTARTGYLWHEVDKTGASNGSNVRRVYEIAALGGVRLAAGPVFVLGELGWSYGHVRDELTTFGGQLEVTERSGNHLLYELALGAHWSRVDLRLGVEYADTDPAIGNTRVVLAFGVDVFDSHR